MRRCPLVLLPILALLPSMASAYEVKRTPGGEPIRWRVDRVSIELHRSIRAHLEPSDGMASLSLAADAWTGIGGPDLRLDPQMSMHAHRPGNAGVQVVWPERWEHAPHLLAVTATSYVESTGQIMDADILVNPDADIGFLEEGEAGQFDLGAVVSHEAGHVLGLGESEVDGATMWPRIGRGETHQRELSSDDIDGVAEAYRDAVMVAPSGCGRASVVSRTLHPAVLGFALIGLLAALLTGRRRLAMGCFVFAVCTASALGHDGSSTASAQVDPSRFGVDTHHEARLRLGLTGVVRRAQTVRGRDGYLRTHVTVGTQDIVVPGGCLGGFCMQVGNELPPSVGRTIAVDPHSGGWAYRRADRLTGGWMAPPPLQSF